VNKIVIFIKILSKIERGRIGWGRIYGAGG
jgi:hypothetical protein